MTTTDSRTAASVARREPLGARRRAGTLGEAFDPRRNSLAAMRLALAALVAVTHALSTAYGHQPHLGSTALGDMAVDGFFVLSGFLVARSYVHLRSFGRFAWHRFLRVMPGFWVCLAVTAFVLAPVAALLAGREPAGVLAGGDQPAWRYVLVNAALPIVQFGIGGLRTPLGTVALDGSLWTLQYEAFCYGVVGLLGLWGVLHRRGGLLLVLCGLAWAAVALDAAGAIPVDVPVLTNESLSRFLLVFLLGASGWVFADRIPISSRWAAGSFLVVVAAAFLPDYRLVAAVPFAYLCLWCVVRLPLRGNPAWDVSYGLYVYHFPVQFLLVLAGAAVLPEAVFVVISLAATVPLAAASWWAVERPALRLKGLRGSFVRSSDGRPPTG